MDKPVKEFEDEEEGVGEEESPVMPDRENKKYEIEDDEEGENEEPEENAISSVRKDTRSNIDYEHYDDIVPHDFSSNDEIIESTPNIGMMGMMARALTKKIKKVKKVKKRII